jgi:hypothetical protein
VATATRIEPSVETMANEVSRRYRELKAKSNGSRVDFSSILFEIVTSYGFQGENIGIMRSLVSREIASRRTEASRRKRNFR